MPARVAAHSAAVPKSADRRATPTIYTNRPAVWFRRMSSAVRRNRTGAPGSHQRTWDKKDGRAAPRSHLLLSFSFVSWRKNARTLRQIAGISISEWAPCVERDAAIHLNVKEYGFGQQ